MHAARLVVWDFDGVIKESVDVKADAYVRLFAPFGAEVAAAVRRHHDDHGGMSRLEKIPLYLRYAGETPGRERVEALCTRFGELVEQAVIDAPWVEGVEAYLRRNARRQTFAVVSATPRPELQRVLAALALSHCFAEVTGAPTSKSDGIRLALARSAATVEETVMVGDADADLQAARCCGVAFVLRRHASNGSVCEGYDGPSITDFATA